MRKGDTNLLCGGLEGLNGRVTLHITSRTELFTGGGGAIGRGGWFAQDEILYPGLIVGVDQKPLLGIINGKRLEDIDNMRLRRLKEKTFGWKFDTVHIPGRKKLCSRCYVQGSTSGSRTSERDVWRCSM